MNNIQIMSSRGGPIALGVILTVGSITQSVAMEDASHSEDLALGSLSCDTLVSGMWDIEGVEFDSASRLDRISEELLELHLRLNTIRRQQSRGSDVNLRSEEQSHLLTRIGVLENEERALLFAPLDDQIEKTEQAFELLKSVRERMGGAQ